MAKVSFSKLDVKLNNESNAVNYVNSKEEICSYEIKKYLPIKEKIDLISNVVNKSVDDNGFYNPIRVKIFMTLEIVFFYTNLNFTAKQKEDPFKLYDLLVNSGIFNTVISNIKEEWEEIKEDIITTIDNVYKYKNSAVGILDNITSDYEGLNLEASNIQSLLENTENLSLLKDVLVKLG